MAVEAQTLRMGSREIISALLLHMQGQHSPLFTAERRRALPEFSRLSRLGRRLVVPGLLLIFVACNAADTLGGASLALYRDEFFTLFMGGGALLFSLSWVLPVAALAGAFIGRERTAQTWDSLLTLPVAREEVFLAKAAAALRGVFATCLSLAGMSVMVGVIIALVVALFVPLRALEGWLLTGELILRVICALAVPFSLYQERQSEIALAATIGMAAATRRNPVHTLSLTFARGVLIRLLPAIFVLALIGPRGWPNGLVENLAALAGYFPQNAPLMAVLLNIVVAFLIGPTALLLLWPTVPTLILLMALLAAREWLTRRLFAWAVGPAD
jgi:hypothetical protein